MNSPTKPIKPRVVEHKCICFHCGAVFAWGEEHVCVPDKEKKKNV